jgi:hypothetical protein
MGRRWPAPRACGIFLVTVDLLAPFFRQGGAVRFSSLTSEAGRFPAWLRLSGQRHENPMVRDNDLRKGLSGKKAGRKARTAGIPDRKPDPAAASLRPLPVPLRKNGAPTAADRSAVPAPGVRHESETRCEALPP